MTAEPSPSPSLTPSLSPPPSQGWLRKVFLNDRGLRGGWRLLIYAVFVAGLGFGGGSALQHFFPLATGALPSPGSLLLQEAFSFLAIFASALIMARIEHRPPGVYGLPWRGALGKLFWQGWLIGLIEVSVLMGLIAAFGGYSFGRLAVSGMLLLRWGLLWAVCFVVVGLFEEFLFRGYTQYTLADSIGFWPAAIVLSCLFGAGHLRNPGEGLIGAASVVSIALVFALTLRRTGSLWLAVGWHASFDFGETFLFSVPNSGLVFPGHLSDASLHATPKWLTGGSVGPEGSAFSFLIMGILALVVHLLFPPVKTAALPGPGAEPSSAN